MSEHSVEKDTTEPSVEWMLDRLTNYAYDGGLNGTCYECPFASVPLDRLRHVHAADAEAEVQHLLQIFAR